MRLIQKFLNRVMSLLKTTSKRTSVPVRSVLHFAGSSRVWLVIAALAIPAAHADQCEYFDEKTADLVQKQIKTGDILLHYCEPCDMPEPFPLRVRTMQVEKESGYPKPTNIDGVWYSYEDIKLGKAPSMTREEQKFVLESMEMANQGQYRLVINGEGRDLAYLYYRSAPDDINYRNIGVAAGCANGVPPAITYKFPDKGRATGPPPGPHFEDITGVCFDGSCLLDALTLNKEATLFADHHENSGVVATVAPGETLHMERIVTEVKPVHVQVVFDQGRFLEGDEFYILNSLGEGYFRVWYYGRIVEDELMGVSMQQTENGNWAKCPEPDILCWAEARGYPEEIWWALVKTRYGGQGWLREPASFVENMFELE